jgi:hypothetical protein
MRSPIQLSSFVARQPNWVLVCVLLVLGGCATPPGREDIWRERLAAEVPLGSSLEQARSFYARHGLAVTQGVAIRVMNDGRQRSACRDPAAALTARERGQVRGLLTTSETEVTVCLSPDQRVESHHVTTWNSGF